MLSEINVPYAILQPKESFICDGEEEKISANINLCSDYDQSMEKVKNLNKLNVTQLALGSVRLNCLQADFLT